MAATGTRPSPKSCARIIPSRCGPKAMFLPAPYMWRPLGELVESVRTGEAAFDRVFGQSFFAYLAEHPQEAAVFNRVMTQEILWTTPALLKAYDFSRFRRLMDVGGGYGMLLSHILSATPKLEGVLFDQPQVVAEAKELLKGRCRRADQGFVPGSFFDRFPRAAMPTCCAESSTIGKMRMR